MPRQPARTVTRSLRFTAAEWAIVDAKLAQRDFSATARALLLGTEIPEPRLKVRREIIRRRMTEAEAKTVQQLSWIGNNLNQIAKATNQGSGAVPVLGALISLEREARRIANAG
jgi:hypothetical protein